MAEGKEGQPQAGRGRNYLLVKVLKLVIRLR